MNLLNKILVCILAWLQMVHTRCEKPKSESNLTFTTCKYDNLSDNVDLDLTLLWFKNSTVNFTFEMRLNK